jgi:hypothetical protein
MLKSQVANRYSMRPINNIQNTTRQEWKSNNNIQS